MAVESRFVVIRNGVEAKTFMDKKSADEYDKMLDMADNLSEMFSASSVELSDSATEELSIFLAQNREEVLVALLAKKPTKKAAPKAKSVPKAVEAAAVELIDVKTEEVDSDEAAAKTRKSKPKAVKPTLSEAS